MINDNLEIRPTKIKDYVGQTNIINNLNIFIKASKNRNEVLDHVLLYGPQGLGKTTLANIIANEMNSEIRSITAINIDKTKDLVNILISLNPGDTLFIDEIHRLSKSNMELLYSAMEDYYIDIIYGQNQNAKTIRVDIHPFTLIGATTKVNMISKPLNDRFGIKLRLNFYDDKEIIKIIKRTAKVFETKIDNDALVSISNRSRNTPRIANNLFKRVRDFASVLNDNHITLKLCEDAFISLNINSQGLDEFDIKYLKVLMRNFNGGPCGINSLSTSLNCDVETIQEIYEPFLLQKDLIKKTSRGRIITETGITYYNQVINHKNMSR